MMKNSTIKEETYKIKHIKLKENLDVFTAESSDISKLLATGFLKNWISFGVRESLLRTDGRIKFG